MPMNAWRLPTKQRRLRWKISTPAWSATLCGRDDDFLKAGERVYHAYLQAGDDRRAARWASGCVSGCSRSRNSPRHGMACSRRAADRASGGDCVEAGYLLLPMVLRDIGAGSFEAACSTALKAITIGERFADHDLLAIARTLHGVRSHEVGADRTGDGTGRRSHAVGAVGRIVAGHDRAHLSDRDRLLPRGLPAGSRPRMDFGDDRMVRCAAATCRLQRHLHGAPVGNPAAQRRLGWSVDHRRAGPASAF